MELSKKAILDKANLEKLMTKISNEVIDIIKEKDEIYSIEEDNFMIKKIINDVTANYYDLLCNINNAIGLEVRFFDGNSLRPYITKNINSRSDFVEFMSDRVFDLITKTFTFSQKSTFHP